MDPRGLALRRAVEAAPHPAKRVLNSLLLAGLEHEVQRPDDQHREVRLATREIRCLATEPEFIRCISPVEELFQFIASRGPVDGGLLVFVPFPRL